MHPQDIRNSSTAHVLSALQNQAEAQKGVATNFDKLAQNALNFAQYFNDKQRYKEQQEFRQRAYDEDKAFRERAYNDEREERASAREYQKARDERADKQWDKSHALAQDQLKAQKGLWSAQARNIHASADSTEYANAAEAFGNVNVGKDSGLVAGQAFESAGDRLVKKAGGRQAYDEETKKRKQVGINKQAQGSDAYTAHIPKTTNTLAQSQMNRF